MPTDSGIEVEAEERIATMFANCPAFLAWIGANVDPRSRIHIDEIIENQDPETPAAELRPLVLIETPRFDYSDFSQSGVEVDYTTSGGVRVLIESQYLGDDVSAPAAQAAKQAFKRTIGQIRRELMDLRNEPLGTTSYIYFHAIGTTMPPTRTLEANRCRGNDFFAVQWEFTLMQTGGE